MPTAIAARLLADTASEIRSGPDFIVHLRTDYLRRRVHPRAWRQATIAAQVAPPLALLKRHAAVALGRRAWSAHGVVVPLSVIV